MLGGIDTALFLSGFGGFIVLVAILIPLLKWIFPSSPSVKAHKQEIKKLRKDLRKLRSK